MNKKLLGAVLLSFSIAASAWAQDTNKAPKEKKSETITIRKKGDNKEKMTIVIDGDKITVNGKPIEDLKDSDIEVLKNKSNSYAFITPKMRGFVAPNPPMPPGGMKMFRGGMIGNKAMLGVQYEKNDKGAEVKAVTTGSAAEKAGLQKGDIITKINDTKIDNNNELTNIISKQEPGDKITVTYLRNNKETSTTATLDKNKDMLFFNNDGNFNFEMPEMPAFPDMHSFYRKPRLGLQIQDVESGDGVKILDVDSETPAAKAGLQTGDIISKVNGTPVKNLDELRAQIKDIKDGDTLSIQFFRDGKTKTTDIKIPKKLKTAEL
ncbi:MAG: PDZ domain-containing protein [Bacteroidota bacterium]|nr:PDZ domain-containing protein [Bacteroidota bacterium]